MIAGIHQLVGKNDGILESHLAITGIDQRRDCFFIKRLVDQRKRQSIGQHFAEDRTPNRGFNQRANTNPLSLLILLIFRYAALNARLQRNHLAVIGTLHFPGIGKYHALALNIDLFPGHVVKPEDNVLGWHDDGLPVRRR